METERSDAIFRDPFARRLAGERGQAIVNQLKRGRAMAWTMVVRTAVFDELILDCVQNRGADMVINLAAGLDTRPWRMSMPPTLRWVDVDLPEILQYKTDMLRDEDPLCRYEAVYADLTDEKTRAELLSRLGTEARQAVILTEGLLVYLTPEQVSSLARALHEQKSFRWWIIDIIGPRLLRWVQRDLGKSLARGNAPFKFAPAEGSEFFRPLGWREVLFRSTGEEARRLNRQMRGAWLWRLIGSLYSRARREEMRRMSGVVMLERIDA